MPSHKLTKSQRANAERIFERGFVDYYVGSGRMQRNWPCWNLVKMGLVIMDFGPRGSWLKTYVFMPLWSDPIC